MADNADEEAGATRAARVRSLVGLVVGPAAAITMLSLAPPAELGQAGWSTAAVGVWMAIWWATEAIPVPATALLPLPLFPALGITDIGATAAPFAHPLIYLFLGGFLIALAIERWNLHRRIALGIVARAGSRPGGLIGGVMVATALLSMWISNTATAMMMLPIAASLVAVVSSEAGGQTDRERRHFATAMMLAVAYSASIGGLGTLIGSPPNALLASFMEQTYGVRVRFTDWMTIGLPIAAIMLPLAWLALTRVLFRFHFVDRLGSEAVIDRARREMGEMKAPERLVALVFIAVATLWIANPAINRLLGTDVLTDAGIAIGGALLLFAIPVDWKQRVFLLDWEWAKRAPWGILLLFGGGLSLARAVDQTGLAVWIGEFLHAVSGQHPVILVLAVVALVVFLTELTSNTATTAAFLPVVGAVAVAAGVPPLLLAAPAAVAASCAFMLPVATPPNAIVYGSGHITVPQMVRAGFVLNLVGIAVVTTVGYWIIIRMPAG